MFWFVKIVIVIFEGKVLVDVVVFKLDEEEFDDEDVVILECEEFFN